MKFLTGSDKHSALEEKQNVDIAGLISFQNLVSSASSAPGSELSAGNREMGCGSCLPGQGNPAVMRADYALETDRGSGRVENRGDKL